MYSVRYIPVLTLNIYRYRIYCRFRYCIYYNLIRKLFRACRASGWTINEKNKAEVLGFKLCLGLEMLLSRNLSHTTTDDQLLQPTGPAWTAYLTRLASLGYFQGELEGSCRYRELAARAAQFWQQDSSDEQGAGRTRLDRLLSLVARLQNSSLSDRPATGWLQPAPLQDDNETWLEVTPESLDRYRYSYWVGCDKMYGTGSYRYKLMASSVEPNF